MEPTAVADSTIPRLFLLCGLPFSGKSTLSRALRKRFGIEHVEVDRYVEELVGTSRRPEPSDWLPAYRLAIEEIRTQLKAGNPVVFDAVGHRRNHRRRMQRLASEAGAQMTLIYLAVLPAEAHERLLANRRDSVRFDVPDEGFAAVMAEMELPAPEENAIVYLPAEPLADWLEREIAPLLAGTAVEEQR